MAGTKLISAFGLEDVAVALPVVTPGTEPAWIDVPSVESAAFQLKVAEQEQWGDQILQQVFRHSQAGELTVKYNKMSMLLFEALTGSVVTSSGAVEKLTFGTTRELLPPILTVRAFMPYRNGAGVASRMTVYFYRCDMQTPWDSFPGGERTKIAEGTLKFRTYQSAVDYKGNVLTEPAFGHFEV